MSGENLEGLGRPAYPEDLVSTWEMARFAGVKQATVGVWVSRYADFPEPWAAFGEHKRHNRLWLRSEFEAWCVQYGIVEKGTRWPDVRPADDLLTASEVAELCGWKSSGEPAALVKRGNFPRWVREYGRTKLWRRADVEHWLATAPRKPRRSRS